MASRVEMRKPADLRTISGRLKASRVLMNLSWKQMAYRLGIAEITCKHKERGNRPINDQELRIWAKYGRTTTEWLLTGQGKEPAGIERIDHIKTDGTVYERFPTELSRIMRF